MKFIIGSISICIALFVVLLAVPAVFAGSDVVFLPDGSKIDYTKLPLYNVFVPWEHKNINILKLTLDELDEITLSAAGRSWNDMPRLCQSITIVYGRPGVGCEVQHRYVAPVYAKVFFRIIPPPPVRVVYTDPMYPPWAPTYN